MHWVVFNTDFIYTLYIQYLHYISSPRQGDEVYAYLLARQIRTQPQPSPPKATQIRWPNTDMCLQRQLQGIKNNKPMTLSTNRNHF